MPQTCLLNNNVAGLPEPNGVVHICNRAIFMSLLDLTFFECLLNKFDAGLDLSITLMVVCHNVACSTLIALQNFWNLSEMKFVPVTLFFGVYSANIILTALVRFSADSPSNLLMTGNLLL